MWLGKQRACAPLHVQLAFSLLQGPSCPAGFKCEGTDVAGDLTLLLEFVNMPCCCTCVHNV